MSLQIPDHIRCAGLNVPTGAISPLSALAGPRSGSGNLYAARSTRNSWRREPYGPLLLPSCHEDRRINHRSAHQRKLPARLRGIPIGKMGGTPTAASATSPTCHRTPVVYPALRWALPVLRLPTDPRHPSHHPAPRFPVQRTVSLLTREQALHRPNDPLEAIYADALYFERFVHNHMTKVFSLTPEDRADSYFRIVPIDEQRLDAAKQNLERVAALGVQEQFGDFSRPSGITGGGSARWRMRR